jgi:hypothetical protein
MVRLDHVGSAVVDDGAANLPSNQAVAGAGIDQGLG